MASISDVSSNDHRNRYRVGKCGRHARKPESIARQKVKLAAFWDDPANRERQSELTRARMALPGVSEKIAERTAAALADPAVKQRHKAGLKARFADPDLRALISERTKAGMAKWRADHLEAAETVLRQLPRAERERAMAGLASATSMDKRP